MHVMCIIFYAHYAIYLEVLCYLNDSWFITVALVFLLGIEQISKASVAVSNLFGKQ